MTGTYKCGNGGTPEDVLELRADGTLTFTPTGPGAPPPEEGTWSIDGTEGVFKFAAFEDTFTADGDSLEFAHAGAPPSDKFICTRES